MATLSYITIAGTEAQQKTSCEYSTGKQTLMTICFHSNISSFILSEEFFSARLRWQHRNQEELDAIGKKSVFLYFVTIAKKILVKIIPPWQHNFTILNADIRVVLLLHINTITQEKQQFIPK